MADSTAHPPPAVDRRVQRLATRVSIALAGAASLILMYLGFSASHTMSPSTFARNSCDAAFRRVLTPDRRVAQLRSSSDWRHRSVALASSVVSPLCGLRLLVGSSHVLCLAAGAGNAVDALNAARVSVVTVIDLVDFSPLVRRADHHRLPFSDNPAGFAGSLFPTRGAAEAERAVLHGGPSRSSSNGSWTPVPVAGALQEVTRLGCQGCHLGWIPSQVAIFSE
ncbi:hypothetical protein VPH35_016088 [Triticum aestivum]